MDVNKFLKDLDELIQIPCITGFEKPIMDFISSKVDSSKYSVDQSNDVLAIKSINNSEKNIVLIHVDRLGIFVNSDGKYEYVKFHFEEKSKSKNLFRPPQYYSRLASRYVKDKVYAYDEKGVSMGEGVVLGYTCDVEGENIYYDIDGLSKLPPLTPIALVSDLTLDEDLISSQIDNVVSVALMMQFLEGSFEGTVLFTTKEESGLSWKGALEYLKKNNVNSKQLVVLDTSPFKTLDKIKEGVVVLRNEDGYAKFNPELLLAVKKICVDNNIPFLLKDELIKNNALPRKHPSLGFTELGKLIVKSNGEYDGVVIQIPSTNYHSNNETTSIKALRNTYVVLEEFFKH